MALVVASSQSPSKIDPTSSLRITLQTFRCVLTETQQKQFSQQYRKPEASDVLSFVAELDANNRSRAGKCVASRICTFLEAIQQFTGIVDTFVSSHPSIAALVWGSVKTALLVASNATSYFDKVTSMIMEVGRFCPALASLGPLYPGCVRLQEALCEYYSAVVKLCIRVVEVLKRTGLKHVWSSVFNSFESEFKPDLQEIDQAVKLVHMQISLASKQAAIETSKLMELDRKSNEAYRLSSFKFRTDVAKEHEAAHIWRMRKSQEKAEKMRRDIKNRLSTIDHLKPWKQAQRQRMASTAEWFQREAVFHDWRKDDKSSALWCAGLIGSGKTVFASNVISYLHRTRKMNEVIAHHFCQSDHESSLSAREIFGALTRQIVDPQLESAKDNDLRILYEQCADADTTDVVAILRSQLREDKMYFVVIDGLDECVKAEIQTVAANMAELCGQSAKRLKVMYIGRPGLEENLFGGFLTAKYKLPLTKAAVTQDIETYIAGRLDQCLEKGHLKLNDPALILHIENTLQKEADGMFLWVFLFIDEICAQNNDDEILKALRKPPRQLSELLDLKVTRVRGTRAAHQAVRVLQLCGVAKRPLSRDELREVMSVSIGQDTLDLSCLPHSMEEIVDQCSGLIYIDEEDFSVQYAHHSIQQYLFSHQSLYRTEFLRDELDENLGFLALTYLHFKEFGRQLAKVGKDAKVAIKPIDFATSSVGNLHGKTGRIAQLFLRDRKSLQKLSKSELERKAQELAGENTTDRLTWELAKRQFHFLNYARKYWIHHLVRINVEKSIKMGRLFQTCVDGHNDLAWRPWLSVQSNGVKAGNKSREIDDAVDWAITVGHIALFKHCVGKDTYVFSEWRKEDIFRKSDPATVRDFLEIIITQTKCQNKTVQKFLVLAAGHGLLNVITMILDRAGDILTFSARVKGRTALQAAAGGGHLELVERLLTAKAYVNDAAAGQRGRTALQAAAGGGHLEVVERLLVAKADVNAAAAENSGRTALQAAAEGGHLEIVARLKAAAALS